VSGTDGNIWFGDTGRIRRITPDGRLAEFSLPFGITPFDIAVGPDGNFWLTPFDGAKILRFTPRGTPGDTCVPSDTVLCIDDKPGDRRFKIEVQYETAQAGGLTGHGHAVPLVSAGLGRGGVFWFFSEDNPEVFIKVLDGCGLNQKHWVFLSAGTNVGYIVTVQDLVSGVVRSYYNVDQKPAPVVQDTDAFPCTGSAP